MVTPLKTTMEAIESEKKEALGLASRCLKDLKDANTKLAQVKRDLAARAAEEQAPQPPKKAGFLGGLFRKEKTVGVLEADKGEMERKLAAAKTGHDQTIPNVVAQLTRCEEQRLSAMRSALEVYARATGDLATCMQTTTPKALVHIGQMDVALDVADVLAKIEGSCAPVVGVGGLPAPNEFPDAIGGEGGSAAEGNKQTGEGAVW